MPLPAGANTGVPPQAGRSTLASTTIRQADIRLEPPRNLPDPIALDPKKSNHLLILLLLRRTQT